MVVWVLNLLIKSNQAIEHLHLVFISFCGAFGQRDLKETLFKTLNRAPIKGTRSYRPKNTEFFSNDM